jgi:hypothetical protein
MKPAYAPFAWDVKRGAAGFNLMLRQKQFDQKQRRKIVIAFVKGYVDGLLDPRCSRLTYAPALSRSWRHGCMLCKTVNLTSRELDIGMIFAL